MGQEGWVISWEPVHTAFSEDQSTVPSTQWGSWQLPVAPGHWTALGTPAWNVNMSAGLGSVKHGHTSLLTGRGSGLHSQYHKRHCSLCWFLKCETLPLPPCREIYNTPVFLYSKNRKDLCEYVTVCSMIMGPGLLMQKWGHLNQSMTYLSGIHHHKQGAQTVALSGELRAL